MTKYSARPVDRIYHALGHPTRSAVVRRLAAGPAAVSVLAEPFRIALPSFLQHIQVLESAGLVRTRREGRTRICELDPEPLREAAEWLSEQRLLWEQRLDQLDRYLLTMEEPE
jgi:DNA-binding transcriptional ArsR family regulator